MLIKETLVNLNEGMTELLGAQVAFIDVDFPELQLALVQLALFHSGEDTLIHHVIANVGL